MSRWYAPGPMPGLTATTDATPDGPRVRLAGELDIATAPQADEELRHAESGGPDRLTLDLSSLSFMDSTGLRLVVAAEQRAQESGRQLYVTRGPEAVQRVFELTGVDERLRFVE